MTQTTLTAGGASDSLALAAGDDGTLVFKTGPTGAKVNALSFASDGTPTFLKGGPCFSAYLSAAQGVTSGVLSKLAANTEEFDTNTSYDNVTNYRFTPLTAGYYQVNGHIALSATSGVTAGQATVYKNGTRFKDGPIVYPAGAPALSGASVSTLVYMNGTTDYIELFGSVTGTGTITFGASTTTLSYFQASFVRGT